MFYLYIKKFELQHEWVYNHTHFSVDIAFYNTEGDYGIKCSIAGTELLLISETWF